MAIVTIPNGIEGVEYRALSDFGTGYCVGSDGSLWSRRKRGTSGQLYSNWRQLHPYVSTDGYRVLQLSRSPGEPFEMQFLHVLVLTAFTGPKPEGLISRHLDGNKLNNATSNLVWGTPAENMDDRKRLDEQPCGEAHHKVRLTIRNVVEIISRWRLGECQTALATEFGVAQTTISAIVTGRTWKRALAQEGIRLW